MPGLVPGGWPGAMPPPDVWGVVLMGGTSMTACLLPVGAASTPRTCVGSERGAVGTGWAQDTLLGPEGTAAVGGVSRAGLVLLVVACSFGGGLLVVVVGWSRAIGPADRVQLAVRVVLAVSGAGGGPGRCLRTAQWTRASLFSVVEVCKGTGWMPWHQEPKKDVVACDMPRGVGKRTVIRGSPNGETPHQSCGATRT